MARAVTESALMAALSFVLYLGSSLPLLGGFFILLCPVPLTLVGLRHGVRRAVLSSVCAALLVTLVSGGPVQGYLFLVPFGFVGIITGWMLARRHAPGRALLVAATVMTLAVTPAMTFLEKAIGLEDLCAESQKMMTSVLETQYHGASTPMAQVEQQRLKETLFTMIRLPLAPFFLFSLAFLYVNHLISYKVFLRLGIEVHPPPDPRRFRLPLLVAVALPPLWIGYIKAGGPNGTLAASLLLNGFFVAGQLAWMGGVVAVARFLSPETPLSYPKTLLLALFLFTLVPITMIFGICEALVFSTADRAPSSSRKPLVDAAVTEG